MKYIINNLATFIVATIVILIVTLVIRSMIKDKKSGKCSCSCGGCKGCPSSSMCHSPKIVTINLNKDHDSDKSVSIK